MSLAARIRRTPRPFDAALGAETADAAPALGPEMHALLAGAAGCSPHLRALIAAEPEWLERLAGEGPEAARDALLAATAEEAAAPGPHLRRLKRRLALTVALADLAGAWSLAEVTGALTAFADAAVTAALRHILAPELARGRLPGQTEADLDTLAGMVVLAMGKMGAGELNYSSDIDLIALFDDERYPGDAYPQARSVFVRATRSMAALMSEQTGEGYVFRTDLRLRPDPSVTPVCLSMDAAERYYESLGRTWERAAHIKARPAAGDIAAGTAYLQRLAPFVWRRHLDFAAIEDAHAMRQAIRTHKTGHADRLEGFNLKLGRGGIRDIEFFAQTRQIIAGGRDPSLRVRGTCEALAALAAAGWIPGEVADTLAQAYAEHREVEHRLQMIDDAQTHSLPKGAEGMERLAAFMDTDAETLRRTLSERLGRVRAQTEAFFVPAPGRREPPPLSDKARAITGRWRGYPALRSSRASEIFARVEPLLLERLARAGDPDDALLHIDAFLAGLPAGVQVFSLFEANPALIDLIVDIAATAPQLARHLGRNAAVFDAVIGGDFFAPWPGVAALRTELAGQMAREGTDYEAQLSAARRWAREWHFRVGVHLLRGLTDAEAAGTQYAELAEAVLAAVAPVVEADFSRRHGAPPGRGWSVLGMGSLGAGRLTATSDLDLIVIYDAAGESASDGRRPLPAGTYYARLTQALVTALTAPMAEGRLYEVDMRLRPSGRQGPVATSLDSFRSYQREKAWTWEHLALTRARPVAGNAELGAEVEAFRAALLAEPADRARVLADVAEMRARLANARPPEGAWDAKFGRGRLQEIELAAQAAARLAGDPARDVAGQIAVGAASGFFDAAGAEALAAAYALCWQLQSAARLTLSGAVDWDTAPPGARAFLLRLTGFDGLPALAEALETRTAAAAAVIDGCLGPLEGAAEAGRDRA